MTTRTAFTAESIIAPGAKLEKLGGGYAFTEGPAADKDRKSTRLNSSHQ